MRTTMTLDDDVASHLKPLLARGKPKQVINDLLRKALGIKRGSKPKLEAFELELRPGIDPVSFNRIAESLAAGEDLERYLP